MKSPSSSCDANTFALNRQILLRPLGDSGVEVHVPQSGICFDAPKELYELLRDLSNASPFTNEGFIEIAAGIVGSTLAEFLFPQLLAAEVIVHHAKPATKDTQPDFNWCSMGWGVASLFHEATIGADFLKGDADGMRTQIRGLEIIHGEGDGPPMKKSYNSLPIIDLPKHIDRPGPDFFAVLKQRRTCRSFRPPKVMTIGTFSTLVHYAAGIQKTVRSPLGPQALKTSPSGGARHPIELYPQIFRVSGLAEGSYYYDPLQHRLVHLGPTSASSIFAMGQNQSGCAEMNVAFILTIRFSRNLWKYRYAKSYAFSLLDLGHLSQTLILTATALGFRTFLTPALNVVQANEHLRLPNPFDECAAYLVTVG
jgi:SagB-type dehydrogenase family enzyme